LLTLTIFDERCNRDVHYPYWFGLLLQPPKVHDLKF
jgi:hypothetical protein